MALAGFAWGIVLVVLWAGFGCWRWQGWMLAWARFGCLCWQAVGVGIGRGLVLVVGTISEWVLGAGERAGKGSGLNARRH